jgi:sarcosine oxidase subunit gamma
MAETLARGSVDLAAGPESCPPRARYSLRVDLASAAARPAPRLPISTTPCRALVRGEWSALWLGPDEQLVIGPVEDGPAFLDSTAEALRGLHYSLVDVSHRQGALAVTGRHAAALINTACPLDLGLAAAPVGFCSRTVFAKAEVVLWRRSRELWQLEVWRSFLPYVSALLALAAREHGQLASDRPIRED